MRRHIGISSIQKKQLEGEKYKDKGILIADAQINELSRLLIFLKQNLKEFSSIHNNAIKKEPILRNHFQKMCSSIGVDPLASSKGFWSELLGVGDIYYELAVQIIEICMSLSHITGGLMKLNELKNRINKSRGNKLQISSDDILRAIQKIEILGNGFIVIPLSEDQYLVQSIPGEFSMDKSAIFQIAESNNGLINVMLLVKNLSWSIERCQKSLNELVKEGIAWVDNQNEEKNFWILSIFHT